MKTPEYKPYIDDLVEAVMVRTKENTQTVDDAEGEVE